MRGTRGWRSLNPLSMILAAMALLGALYYVLSTLALAAHFGRRRPLRLGDVPRVSLLKPVTGADPELRHNLETYLHQDYPDYETLIGVLDAGDPAAPILSELANSHVNASFHTGSAITGANNKVRILHELAAHATGEILVISDADTRVGPDFIARLMGYFTDPSVGAATCFYRGERARTTGDGLEALHMTCVFAPGVAAAELLGGINFALGAAVAIRREVLDRIGGFAAIADYLADDFQLGRRTAMAGYRIELTDYVVEITLGGETIPEVLRREMRWCRTTRVSNPRGHFGLVATFGFAYAVLFALSSGFAGGAWLCLAGVTLIRFLTAWYGAACLGDLHFLSRAWLLPLRDLLSLGIWIGGYCSRCVTWRGRRLKVFSDGTMKSVAR